MKLLKLRSLQRCRLRSLEVFEEDVARILMTSNHDRTRRDASKLIKRRFDKEIGRNWLTDRVSDDWNRFSCHVVSAESIADLKRRLDSFRYRDAR